MEERSWDWPLSNSLNIIVRTRKVKKSLMHPIGVEFAVIGQVKMQDELRDVIRVDNSPHRGAPGTHVHVLSKRTESVKYVEIKSSEQALDYTVKYLAEQYPWLL